MVLLRPTIYPPPPPIRNPPPSLTLTKGDSPMGQAEAQLKIFTLAPPLDDDMNSLLIQRLANPLSVSAMASQEDGNPV